MQGWWAILLRLRGGIGLQVDEVIVVTLQSDLAPAWQHRPKGYPPEDDHTDGSAVPPSTTRAVQLGQATFLPVTATVGGSGSV